jgi:hypothetical protein
MMLMIKGLFSKKPHCIKFIRTHSRQVSRFFSRR